MMRPDIRLYFFALAALLIAPGCGDSTLSHTAHRDDPDGPVNNAGADTHNPDGTPIGETCCILIPAGGERELTVDQLGQITLGVFLFDKETGEPRPNELISWEILESPAEVELNNRTANTDESGLGKVRFFAGEQIREYVVRASHPGANQVELVVSVGDLPSGDLEVSFIHSGASIYPVAPIEVMVFPDNVYRCDDFQPLNRLPDPDYFDEVRNVDRKAEFNTLLTRNAWTVVALGRGEFGQRAAAACSDDIRIRDSETTRVELVLILLPLNPVGRYDSVSHWDFTATLENTGNVGQVLLAIFDAFENPGRFLLNSIIDLIRSFLGGLIAGAVDFFLDIFGLDDLIENGINGFIGGNDFLSRLQQAGLDLRDMVTNLEVLSTLTIGKLGNDYQVYGSDDWRGLAVYWRWDCDENSPPDCGRIEIALDSGSDLGFVYGEWTGQVAAYNQLQIFTHSVNLRYGQLILYLLNNILIPALTDGNAHSMIEAILYWIDCEGLSLAITGNDGEICAPADIVCIDAEDIEAVCDSVIRSVFGFAEVLLGNLAVDSVIELSGNAKLVEMDGDLLVDEILDGEYNGWVNIQGERSPFTATWSATRIERSDDED
jgi:hypothetical protein